MINKNKELCGYYDMISRYIINVHIIYLIVYSYINIMSLRRLMMRLVRQPVKPIVQQVRCFSGYHPTAQVSDKFIIRI